MSTRPCRKLIAEQSGMTESEVGTYLVDLQEQPDGSWLVFFGVEIGKRPELCEALTTDRTLRIPEWLASCWVDRDKEYLR